MKARKLKYLINSKLTREQDVYQSILDSLKNGEVTIKHIDKPEKRRYAREF